MTAFYEEATMDIDLLVLSPPPLSHQFIIELPDKYEGGAQRERKPARERHCPYTRPSNNGPGEFPMPQLSALDNVLTSTLPFSDL